MIAAGGFEIHKGWLDRAPRRRWSADIGRVADAAPFFAPLTPWGKPMSVRMTSAGRYGWYHRPAGLSLCRPPSGGHALAADAGVRPGGLARARLDRRAIRTAVW